MVATTPSSIRIARVFLPFALGYFLSNVFRTVNSVIASNLIHDVGLSATDLGFLTSAFFLGFAAAQLPIGILLDRFGPRRVDAALLVLAAAGALVFALSHSVATLSLGRALIGLGVSACMMAGFKAFVQWFDTDRLAFINGCMMGCGALGALAATVPVEWVLNAMGWRSLFVAIAAASGMLAIALWRVVPEHAEPPAQVTLRSQIDGLKTIFCDQFFWRVTLLNAVAQGCFLAVQGLWAGPWLRDVAGLDAHAAARHLAALAAAAIAGFFLTGSLAARLVRLGISLVAIIGAGLGIFLVIVCLLAAGVHRAAWLIWVAFGFFGTASTLVFALLSQTFPRDLAGRVNTAFNLIVFAAAFLIQWGMGAIIHHWEDPVTHAYAPRGYQAAFAVIALLLAVTLAWFMAPRTSASRKGRTMAPGSLDTLRHSGESRNPGQSGE